MPQSVTGNFDLVIGETPSGTPGPPPHYHNIYHEVFLVIEGEMEFMVNGKSMVIKKGDSVNLPPSSVHTFANKSSKFGWPRERFGPVLAPFGFFASPLELETPLAEPGGDFDATTCDIGSSL